MRSVISKLNNVCVDLNLDNTSTIDVASSHLYMRWDLHPKDKARIIANRLSTEFLANLQPILSSVANNCEVPIIPNKIKKKPKNVEGGKTDLKT